MINLFIVDDHALFRLGTKTYLSTQSKHINVVGEAENGCDLFCKLNEMEEKPQMLLLDVVMPDMSGIEVLKRVRDEYPDMLVLMFSAETSFEVISQLIDIGIDGFISKSATYHDLVGAIYTVSKGGIYLGSDIARLIHSVSIVKQSIEALTDREREIMELAAQGFTAKDIAEQLNITIRTVDTHKNNIFRKMGFKNSAELVKFALKYGIIEL